MVITPDSKSKQKWETALLLSKGPLPMNVRKENSEEFVERGKECLLEVHAVGRRTVTLMVAALLAASIAGVVAGTELGEQESARVTEGGVKIEKRMTEMVGGMSLPYALTEKVGIL